MSHRNHVSHNSPDSQICIPFYRTKLGCTWPKSEWYKLVDFLEKLWGVVSRVARNLWPLWSTSMVRELAELELLLGVLHFQRFPCFNTIIDFTTAWLTDFTGCLEPLSLISRQLIFFLLYTKRGISITIHATFVLLIICIRSIKKVLLFCWPFLAFSTFKNFLNFLIPWLSCLQFTNV